MEVETTASLAAESVIKAECFLLSCIKNGLACSLDTKRNRWVKPYPEVTGYLLSYFSKKPVVPKQVEKAAQRLIELQNPIGGFSSFKYKTLLYTFDTAQIMHGFCSLYAASSDEVYLKAAEKCGDFLLSMQLPNGAMFPLYDCKNKTKFAIGKSWGNSFSFIQVKNIEGLLLLSNFTKNKKWLDSAQRLCEWGKKNVDLTYTHPGAYCLEGLLAIGETDFVKKCLRAQILPRIQGNGFLPYSPVLEYAYTSGSVQMAILLYKVGLIEPSKQILDWARKVQSDHASGGLYQYANPDATINRAIHSEINSWGTKYFVELEKLVSN